MISGEKERIWKKDSKEYVEKVDPKRSQWQQYFL
jgi:hypothetical protein